MKICLIVAAAENGVIGRDGRLPWYLPADLKHFKRLTLGHAVIMGRKTHESIVERLGRPLPKRRSLVLSRDAARELEGVETATSLEQALALAAGHRDTAESADQDCVFVAGGASVFAEALPLADRLYLTRVHTDVEGDVFLPEIEWRAWTLAERQRHEADERHAHALTFETYERR